MLTKLQALWKHSIPDFLSHPLWQQRPLDPFLRLVYLQLRFGVGTKRLDLPWISGLRLPVEQGDHGLTGNFYLGLQEFKDMAFALHLMRQEELFVDVGANLGAYSILVTACAGASSLAYEPVPATYQRLLEVVRLNRLDDRIQAMNLALSSAAEEAEGAQLAFSIDRGCGNSFVDISYPGEKIFVDVSTLDSHCSSRNPVLMKIDVEGFEEAVLAGAATTLAADSLLAIVIEGQTDSVNAILRDADFVDRSYLPLQRMLIPVAGYTANRIWIKERWLGEVEERLRTAPIQTVYGRRF